MPRGGVTGFTVYLQLRCGLCGPMTGASRRAIYAGARTAGMDMMEAMAASTSSWVTGGVIGLSGYVPV